MDTCNNEEAQSEEYGRPVWQQIDGHSSVDHRHVLCFLEQLLT